MKTRLLICLLTICMIAALSGCGGEAGTAAKPSDAVQTEAKTEAKTETKSETITEAKTETQPQPRTEPAQLSAILDRNGDRLGAIDERAVCTAADAGIFYSVFQPAEYQFTATAEYRFFRAADRQDLLLGRLEKQGYEAVYARTELDGRLYTLAVTGNPLDEAADSLWLLALDPAAGTMNKYEVSADGFPYASMAAVGGKLLILNHETHDPRRDTIYEFDPGSGGLRTLLSFPDDGASTLRGVCAAEDGFCLLRLRLENGRPAELLLDYRDAEGGALSERSLNELLIPAAREFPGFVDEAELLNEFGMMVSSFSLWEGRYLCYGNFGLLRAVLDLERGEALLTKDDLWSLSLGSGSPALYRLDFEAAAEGPEILVMGNGAFEKLPLAPQEAHPLLRGLSHSPGGNWLAELADSPRSFGATRVLCFWQEP